MRRTEESVRHLPSPLFTLQSSNSAGVFTGEGRNQAEMVRKCRGFKFFTKRSVWFEFQPNRTRDHKVEAPVQFHPEGSLPVAGALHVGLDVREEGGHVLRVVQMWNNFFLEICNSAEIGLHTHQKSVSYNVSLINVTECNQPDGSPCTVIVARMSHWKWIG